MYKHYTDINYEKTIAKKRLVFDGSIFETIYTAFINLTFILWFLGLTLLSIPLIIIIHSEFNLKNELSNSDLSGLLFLIFMLLTYIWILYITFITPFRYIKRIKLKYVKINSLDIESFWKNHFPNYDYTILNENKLLVSFIPSNWYITLFVHSSIMITLIRDEREIYVNLYSQNLVGAPDAMAYFLQIRIENRIINMLKEYSRNQEEK